MKYYIHIYVYEIEIEAFNFRYYLEQIRVIKNAIFININWRFVRKFAVFSNRSTNKKHKPRNKEEP